MKWIFSVIMVFLLFFSCSQPVDLEKEKQAILDADIAFSNLSVEKGRNFSFLNYCTDDAVLMRNNGYPLVGKEKIAERINSFPDTSYKLRWKPLFASVAKSADLGYSYGTYLLETKDNEGKPLTDEGTYCTIWRKQADGTWKWVLDVGNEGLGRK